VRRIFSFCLLFGLVAESFAQGYYRNPTDLPMLLSGNFGELRPNHYHMGLDIKTAAVENKPIYAAADGFVSRIKVEPGGYGRAIYIQHPNGTTTLYAHLNDFNPSLEKWVKEQQYQQQSWAIDLYPDENMFPLKKGNFIAYSGNTGGSLAPHLHFEIRDTKDGFNLNPLLYQFPVEDKIAPMVTRLAIYDKSLSTYEQQPVIIAVKNAGNNRYITQPGVVKVNAKKIVLGFSAYDTHNNSHNKNGIYRAQLFLNGLPDISFLMDSIHYEDTRYMNAHIDYKTATTRSNWIHQLFQLPGYYPNSIYRTDNGTGTIDLSDGKEHTVKIEITDAYKNKSVIETRLQFSGVEKRAATASGKMFYPDMLDGFEAPNCEFFIGEKCLYEATPIDYAELKATDSNAVSAMHKIGQSYIPLQTRFLVRVKPTREVENSLRSKTLMLWTSGTKKAAEKVNWNQDWASAQFRDFGNYQLVLDTVAPVVKFNFAEGSSQAGRKSISFNVSDKYGYAKVVATIDNQWICFTNDKYRAFVYKFDEHCLPGEHELKVIATDLVGNTTTATIKFVR
jgi:hypothetical protein